jgi:pimeloyl-ACP methyl ester carboxylesterase
LFKKFLSNPSLSISILRLAGKSGLYSWKAIDFYLNHILSEQTRSMVYHSWMLHRLTVPDIGNIISIIHGEKINVLLFFGTRDTIIPPSAGQRFAVQIGHPEALHILDCGHRLHEMSAEICHVIIGENKF